jgi:phosphoribosylanthranilate isomerase
MVVKICGLKTLEEVITAVDAGADMIGFNFYPLSPRYLEPEKCRRIMEEVKRRNINAIFVGVFVNAAAEYVSKVINECLLDLAQLSGDEPLEDIIKLGNKAYKAFRIKSINSLSTEMIRYQQRKSPPTMLIDAHVDGMYGGTGRPCDWELARNIAAEQPILLAGGLTPQNVGKAVEVVKPWGVDVASGVEMMPGCKDPTKMSLFIKAAKKG